MPKTATVNRKEIVKFTIDASIPIKDDIFDIAAYEKYLHDRIKVEGKTGNLSNAIVISRSTSNLTVAVGKNTVFAKRYIKYLTKKFLKKNQLRDFLRVVASSKDGYIIKYFNMSNEEEESDDDDE